MSMTGPTSGLPAPNTTTTTTTTASIPTDQNGYINLPVTVDPLQLTSDAFAFIQAQIAGWNPVEGNLESWLIEACARMVAVAAQVAAQVPLTIFEYYGGALLGLPPNNGAPAQVASTWTMTDDKGYTVPAGTLVTYPTSGNSFVMFQTAAAFTVPPGSTATAAGAVTLTATAVGTAANALAPGPMLPANPLAYVASVESTSTSSGGANPETNAAYLNRLSSQLQLLTPRPILAPDFSALAAQQPGVGRALAINDFNPYANIVTPPDDSFETGIGTAAAVTNCTVDQTANWGLDGTHSLQITATAAGNVLATLGPYPVSAGEAYTAIGSLHAETTLRSCQLNLEWKDINGNSISTSDGTSANDSTSGGVAFAVSDEAPENATTVLVQIAVTGCAASEAHDLDEFGVFLGSNTTWSAGGLMGGQERMVTVVPVDVNGDALQASQMTSLRTYLESMRETNFQVWVVAPTYTAVAVEASVVVNSDADIDTVQAAVEAALTAYLSPGTWAGGSQTPSVWLAERTVYYLSVAGVIENVPDVHHIGSLTVNGGVVDVTLGGYAPLPVPTLDITVTQAPVGT